MGPIFTPQESTTDNLRTIGEMVGASLFLPMAPFMKDNGITIWYLVSEDLYAMIATMREMLETEEPMVREIMKISIVIIRVSGKMIKEMGRANNKLKINPRGTWAVLLTINIMAEAN